MMLVRTYLSNSSIEGIGVFAADPIRKGDLIWRLDPKFDVLFTEGDVAGWPLHMDEFIQRYCYRHRDMPATWVLELDNGRFMNHSEVPNANFEEFYSGYALRDIEIGEELTCNYFDFDVDFNGSFIGVGSNALVGELRT
jgi:SET domain-containing protein